MNPKIKKLFKNMRVLILLSFLLFAIIAINPSPNTKGVTIRHVLLNSSANLAGIKNPSPTSSPLSKERIIGINNLPIEDSYDYLETVSMLSPNQIVTIKTNKGTYTLQVKPITETITLNETEELIVEETYEDYITINGTEVLVNQTRNKTTVVPKTETIVLGAEDIGLNVYNVPKTNIRKGLDLQGGTRVLLRPEDRIEAESMDLLIANMKQRLNIYGLSDIVVRESNDLSGNQYIIVEIAGATEEEVKNLLAKQGKFEAKIGNNTVFKGGDRDITYVCRTSQCSGIDPQRGCGQSAEGYGCRFRFSIALRPEAAEMQASVTEKLKVVTTDEAGNLLSKDEQYLNETLDLFLDDKKIDTLNIGAELQGSAVTDIAISGSGFGLTEQEARFNALANMKNMQTVLVTGSLPVSLEVVKMDTLSPSLGEEFIKNSFMLGFVAILAVSLIIFLRFRRYEIALSMIFIMVSEIVLLLGMAALIGWNLDLAAIAGIIIALGTGVDHAIVIADEILRGETQQYMNWKKKIKSAFFIIMAAYFTTVAAMMPLYKAGAGLLKGFAITTILGLTFGVFITRPAFAAIIEIFLKE